MRDRSKYYTSEDWKEIRDSLKERCDLLVKEKYELIEKIIEDLLSFNYGRDTEEQIIALREKWENEL